MSPIIPRSSRLPRAGIDPITTEASALALVHTVTHWPMRHETIIILLDDARCGIALVVVSGTTEPDAVLEIAERVLDPLAHAGRVGAAIVASIRPGDRDADDPCDHDRGDHDRGDHDRGDHDRGDHDLGDADRWLELDEIATGCGVELIEWFTIDRGVSRPRELVNAPPRW